MHTHVKLEWLVYGPNTILINNEVLPRVARKSIKEQNLNYTSILESLYVNQIAFYWTIRYLSSKKLKNLVID